MYCKYIHFGFYLGYLNFKAKYYCGSQSVKLTEYYTEKSLQGKLTKFPIALFKTSKNNFNRVQIYFITNEEGIISRISQYTTEINIGYIYCWLRVTLGCARFAEIASELTKAWSSGATEFGV